MKPIALVLVALGVAVTLSACGGGGGGSSPIVMPDPVDPVDPMDPVDPTDPVDPVDPTDPVDPGPTVKRGSLALPGLDRIPLDAIKLTNREMQKRFVLVQHAESYDGGVHGEVVRRTACRSYITDCGNPDNYSGKNIDLSGAARVNRTDGTTPYSYFSNSRLIGDSPVADGRKHAEWLMSELSNLGSVKIVTHSITPGGVVGLVELYGASIPFLMVQSAGNDGVDEFPFSQGPLTPNIRNIRAAIAANKVLYVAGHDRRGGRYVRHTGSSGCKGADEGCIWAPFETPGVGAGTSLSAPRVAAALASVLAVFPDTTHQNLAKFAKSCALKGGNGIEALLRQSGGIGVADFTCMGGVMSALANLPTGGSATATVNGSPVRVDGRTLSLSFVNPRVTEHFAEEDTLSFTLVPTDGNNFLFGGLKRHGDLFALAGAGIRDNFFGFSEGHGRMYEIRVEGGHKNAFIRFSEQRSGGGDLISSAKATSLGLTLQKEFQLAGENTTLNLAAHADRFLGGEAEIPHGSVNLNDGEWEHQVNISFVHRF